MTYGYNVAKCAKKYRVDTSRGVCGWKLVDLYKSKILDVQSYFIMDILTLMMLVLCGGKDEST